MGCQGQNAAEPLPPVSLELPTEFSQSYQLAFQANPQLTAQRFLSAYDGFAHYGPVTAESLKNHARLRAATERARGFTDILAMDLNEDGLIIRAEYDALTGLPNGTKKALRLAGLFSFDENQDGYISREEAYVFSQHLNTVRPKNTLRPIESYLMLFDLNGDEQVMRGEVVKALGVHLQVKKRSVAELRGGPALR